MATNLGVALCKAGHEVTAVYSRTMQSAEALATTIGSSPTNDISHLPLQADVFIVSVKDDALQTLIPQLAKGREDQLFVHTAGSMTLSVFEGIMQRYGVFYPMQSFSTERRVDFAEIPVFIEASDNPTLERIRLLAETISQSVYVLSSEERKYLHLAAVFACNFANHCYTLAARVLEEHGLPFSVMLPLIDETARKVHQLHPKEAQTGPAIRYDENVISMQSQLLRDHPEMKEIYERMSQSIHKTATDT